jgi:hypothetical protein
MVMDVVAANRVEALKVRKYGPFRAMPKSTWLLVLLSPISRDN